MTDGHLIVIQYDKHIRTLVACMGQRLKCHAARNSPITDDGDHFSVDTLFLGRQGHAHRRRNAGRGVSDAKGVKGAFGALREPRQPLYLPHAVHAVTPAGEDFVRVGLMSHIPHDPVVGGIKDMVQRYRQLDDAQTSAKVTAGACHRVKQIVSKLFSQLHQFVTLQL